MLKRRMQTGITPTTRHIVKQWKHCVNGSRLTFQSEWTPPKSCRRCRGQRLSQIDPDVCFYWWRGDIGKFHCPHLINQTAAGPEKAKADWQQRLSHQEPEKEGGVGSKVHQGHATQTDKSETHTFSLKLTATKKICLLIFPLLAMKKNACSDTWSHWKIRKL